MACALKNSLQYPQPVTSFVQKALVSLFDESYETMASLWRELPNEGYHYFPGLYFQITGTPVLVRRSHYSTRVPDFVRLEILEW
jgi:hypothetical protein